MLVVRLADFLGRDLADPRVQVSEDFEPDWLAAYHRSRPNSADPAVLQTILAGNPPRAFASVGSPEIVAIARGHLSGPWLGLASIWTATEHRRRGTPARCLAQAHRLAPDQGVASLLTSLERYPNPRDMPLHERWRVRAYLLRSARGWPPAGEPSRGPVGRRGR